MRYGRLGFWYRLVVVVAAPPLRVTTIRDWRRQDLIPRSGGFILAANHISYVDPMTLGLYVLDTGRVPKYLAKSTLFEKPLIKYVFIGAKQIPVYRGTSDAANALTPAVEAVNAGECVVIYPEGTATRDPDCWPMKARTGVARLALMTGAPVRAGRPVGPAAAVALQAEVPAAVPAQEGADPCRAAGRPFGVRRATDDGRGVARRPPTRSWLGSPTCWSSFVAAGRPPSPTTRGWRHDSRRGDRCRLVGHRLRPGPGAIPAPTRSCAPGATEISNAINDLHENPDYLPRITLPA